MSNHPTQKVVALVLTSHPTFGSTGQASGAWYSEVTTPYYVFRDAGWHVIVASIAGGPAVIDPMSRLTEWQTDSTRRFDADAVAIAALAQTMPVENLRADEFSVLFMPGGFGAMWDFPDCLPLTRLIEECAESDQHVVATLCHGAAALVHARTSRGTPLVRDRIIVSFTDSEERALNADAVVPFLLESRLRSLGGAFKGGADFSETACADGCLVSGQNPASAAATAELALFAAIALRENPVSTGIE